MIATYLLELTALFNTFYHAHRVLCDDEPLRDARLRMVDGLRTVIRTGLGLLGIETVDEM